MGRNYADVVGGQLDKSHVSSGGTRESDVLRRHADQAMKVVSSLVNCHLLHVLGLVPGSVELDTVLQNDNDFLPVDANGTDRCLYTDGGDGLLLDDLPQKDLVRIYERE